MTAHNFDPRIWPVGHPYTEAVAYTTIDGAICIIQDPEYAARYGYAVVESEGVEPGVREIPGPVRAFCGRVAFKAAVQVLRTVAESAVPIDVRLVQVTTELTPDLEALPRGCRFQGERPASGFRWRDYTAGYWAIYEVC